MPINPQSAARIDEFLAELAANGVVAIHQSRSVYRIGPMKVSVRTTTKPGPVFWYDVSRSVMSSVEYFIYQADASHHFALIPSSFLASNYHLLQDSNRFGAKQFYIDWLHRNLISHPSFSVSIASYCCSTQRTGAYGNWHDVFRV